MEAVISFETSATDCPPAQCHIFYKDWIHFLTGCNLLWLTFWHILVRRDVSRVANVCWLPNIRFAKKGGRTRKKRNPVFSGGRTNAANCADETGHVEAFESLSFNRYFLLV